MFSKFYEKIKQFIKENYKTLIFFIFLYILFLYPVDYYIITGGGIMKVGSRIRVEDEYKSKGSLNLAYVSEVKGTIATYLLSYIVPDFERIKVSDYTYDNSEDVLDVEFRGEIDLLNASDNAIKNAYLKANKKYEITETNLYVYYKDKMHKNDFKVGDKILKVDDTPITCADDYKNIVGTKEAGDKIKVLVERKNKKKLIEVSLYKQEDRLVSGIYISEVHKYKTDPKVEIKFKKSESGPSGGLIETLDIYNKITKKDVTKGFKIAGTGEIDKDGNIGTIGGVKYKLLGAEKKHADIFLVPNGENYKECIKLKKERNLKIKVIGVSTFSEAVDKLNRINA